MISKMSMYKHKWFAWSQKHSTKFLISPLSSEKIIQNLAHLALPHMSSLYQFHVDWWMKANHNVGRERVRKHSSSTTTHNFPVFQLGSNPIAQLGTAGRYVVFRDNFPPAVGYPLLVLNFRVELCFACLRLKYTLNYRRYMWICKRILFQVYKSVTIRYVKIVFF